MLNSLGNSIDILTTVGVLKEDYERLHRNSKSCCYDFSKNMDRDIMKSMRLIIEAYMEGDFSSWGDENPMREEIDMITPIKPGDVQEAKNVLIPDGVLKAFNEMIASSWNGTESNFTLSEVIDKAIKETGLTEEQLLDNRFMDVETVYQSIGWDVAYDKPAYCESYSSFFVFRKK